MSHDLTRWIEEADARLISETAMLDRNQSAGETHYLHLGEAIARLPSWFKHSVNRESLTAIGCHVLIHRR